MIHISDIVRHMSVTTNPLRASAAWLGALVDTHPWLSPSVATGGTIAGGVLLADPSLRRIVLAVIALAIVGTTEISASWWRQEEERVNGNAAQDYRLAIKDALRPIADRIADLHSLPVDQRDGELKTIAMQAAGACALLFKDDHDRVRSVVFALSSDAEMSVVACAGRADQPRPFVRGTSRGNKAFKVLTEGKPIRIDDVLTDAEAKVWAGTGRGYQTFITVPIVSGGSGYGLLTVDAPEPGTFRETDQYFLEVVASLLAIAYAACKREN